MSTRLCSGSSRVQCVLAAFAGLALLATGAQAQTITAIAPLPGGTTSDALGVSRDGKAVVATTDLFGPGSARGQRSVRNRPQQDLGLLPGATDVWAGAISGNGEVIAGLGFFPDAIHAFRWTRDGGMEDLGGLPGSATHESEAYALNRNGSIVAGVAATADGGFHAVRWTPQGVQDLDGETSYSGAYAISADGNTVSGFADFDSGEHAFRWTPQGGMQDLGAVNPDESSAGSAMTSDGRIIVGYSGFAAAMWRDGQWTSLGLVAGGTYSAAYCVSDRGEVIGGAGDNADGDFVAMISTPSLGMVDLNQYLADIGVDMTGWVLTVTTGISADGRTLVGEGTLNGDERGWVVRLPANWQHCHREHHDNGRRHGHQGKFGGQFGPAQVPGARWGRLEHQGN